MYKKILVALDNSEFSGPCSDAAVALASAFGAQVIGCHAYAAGMHRRRFRQMESTLPDAFLVERQLQRQRAIHSKLIDLGLQLISESYVDELGRRCQAAQIPFATRTFDGRNWQRLAEEVSGSDCDLVVMGVRGHGALREDTVGSVCLRLLRHTCRDSLIIKEPAALDDGAGRAIAVAIDGSPQAFGALESALALGEAFQRPVHAVAAYDPDFHREVFHRMVRVLSQEAARIFRYEEQERLHDQIIDSGLARLYRGHLEVARRMAASRGMALETTLLTGRAGDELLSYVEEKRPWLLLLGRVGVHSGDELDLGSVTEHLLRFAPCNLLVTSRRSVPPASLWDLSELRWTREAESALQQVPEEYRGPLRLVLQRLAREEGHSVVTVALLSAALARLRPAPEEAQPLEAAAMAVAVASLQREPGTIYLCQDCGHVTRGSPPAACAGCGREKPAVLALEVEDLPPALPGGEEVGGIAPAR